MHRSPWHVKSERSEMEELYHDNILWLLFLQFICCVSVLAWCIGIKCTTSWHEERIVPSFTTGCGDNVCVSDCVLAWAVPFSIWLNAHVACWGHFSNHTGQCLARFCWWMLSWKRGNKFPLQYVSRVSVVLCAGRGHSVHSVPVLPTSISLQKDWGGVHTFVVVSRGPVHHFCLLELPLGFVPVILFEPNMFQEGDWGSGGGGR